MKKKKQSEKFGRITVWLPPLVLAKVEREWKKRKKEFDKRSQYITYKLNQ